MVDHTEPFDERSLCFDVTHGNAVGDNLLHLHRNALIAHSGLDDTDLIYANFNNAYNQMPYSIVIDHKWKSVVISIRGTLSLEGKCTISISFHMPTVLLPSIHIIGSF